MIFKTALPVWYGKKLETVLNALIGVGSLTHTGFYISLLYNYD